MFKCLFNAKGKINCNLQVITQRFNTGIVNFNWNVPLCNFSSQGRRDYTGNKNNKSRDFSRDNRKSDSYKGSRDFKGNSKSAKNNKFSKDNKFSSNKKNSYNSTKISSQNSYTGSYPTESSNSRDINISAVKTIKENPFDIKLDSSELITQEERINIHRVIDNPDEVVKLSENDIHAALRKTGRLPESDLKEIIERYKNNDSNNQGGDKNSSISNLSNVSLLQQEVEKYILPKLNLCLNKSLVEICRTGKQNPTLFKKHEKFWVSLQKEIITRVETLSNDQITDIIQSFSKCEITPKIKFFEEIEDTVLDSPAKFLLSQNEKIFYAFSAQKKGSTGFLKTIARRYFRHKNLLDGTKLAKFISELNSHANSIKGNFGHTAEMEEIIKKEIESGNIKFEQLITIAHYLFTDNIGSNDLQRLIETSIVEKFENRIDVEMSSVIKLVRCLSNHYIKNEIICEKVKNYLEGYMNGYISKEENQNEEDDIQDSQDSQDTPSQNLNLIFNQEYTKLITNLNTIIWSLSKNKTFLELAKKDEFKYFYSRLKDNFIRNIDYFNAREFTFSLEGIINLLSSEKNSQLQKDLIFTSEECYTISQKLKNLDYSNITNHDTIKLLKILSQNENLLTDVESFNNLISNAVKNFNSASYQDLIDFIDVIYNFPISFNQHLVEEKQTSLSEFFEKRISPIVPKMDIIYFSKLVNLLSRPVILNLFSREFSQNIFNILQSRLNEIPKEHFPEVLATCTKLKLTSQVENLIEILEDLSNFEDLKTCFNKPQEYLKLLWSMLSLYHRKDWVLKFNQKQSNLIEKFIQSFTIKNNSGEKIDNNKLDSINPDYFVENFLKKDLDINFFLNQNLMNREDNYYKILQIVYLSYLYNKEYLNLDPVISKEFLEKINTHLFTISTKFDLNSRSNYISLDPASKCDKLILEDFNQEITEFFKPKPNATIYPNFIDEFLNAVNIVINFELPQNLSKQYEVIGIDTNIFALVIMNKFYKTVDEKSVMSIYDNRFRILKDVFNFEVKIIEDWGEMNTQEDKQKYLKNMFGFDFTDEENIKIQINKKNSNEEKSKEMKKPRFNLAKSIKLN
jgi:hypothetical protein